MFDNNKHVSHVYIGGTFFWWSSGGESNPGHWRSTFGSKIQREKTTDNRVTHSAQRPVRKATGDLHHVRVPRPSQCWTNLWFFWWLCVGTCWNYWLFDGYLLANSFDGTTLLYMFHWTCCASSSFGRGWTGQHRHPKSYLSLKDIG